MKLNCSPGTCLMQPGQAQRHTLGRKALRDVVCTHASRRDLLSALPRLATIASIWNESTKEARAAKLADATSLAYESRASSATVSAIQRDYDRCGPSCGHVSHNLPKNALCS